MYSALLHSHNLFRYLVLLMLVITILRYAFSHLMKNSYTPLDNRLSLGVLIVTHLQFLIGIALYLVSPNVKAALADMSAAMKNETLRFIAVEHATIMLLAVALITIGRVYAKRANTDDKKFRRSLIFFAAGLIFIIAGIPWEKWLP